MSKQQASDGIRDGFEKALSFFSSDQLASLRVDLRQLMRTKVVADIVEKVIVEHASRYITIHKKPYPADKEQRFVLDVNYRERANVSEETYQKMIALTEYDDDGTVYRGALRCKSSIVDELVAPPTMDLICASVDSCYNLDAATPQLKKIFSMDIPEEVLKNFVMSLPLRHYGDKGMPGSERLFTELR